MAWLAWAALGFVIGTLFKFIARRPGPSGWLASVSVAVAGCLSGAWIGAKVWNQGVLFVSTANLVGGVIGAFVLLALYWYRLRRRDAWTALVNPNAM